MTVLIYPYKTASRSARALRESLTLRFMRTSSGSTLSRSDVVINWGTPRPHARLSQCRLLNTPEAVTRAGCKLTTCQTLTDLTIPFGTTEEWARERQEEGRTVLARTLLRASGGRGIEKILPDTVDIPHALLYTEYVRKASEWRVHVFQGEVFFVQRKIARPDSEPSDWMIRNHDNGFIFQQDYNRDAWHEELGELAVQAVERLGLDFGAVDLIWNNHQNRGFVLEVNTAPGLEGRTLEAYTEQFRRFL